MFITNSVYIKIPWGKSLKLIPFGDVHRDVALCDVERWRGFLRRCRSEDDQYTRYILMGDPCDFASYSERNILKAASLHTTTRRRMDRLVKDTINGFVREISFMRGKMLGVVAGNHNWEYADGTTTDQQIARLLDAKYLGDISYIRITIETCGKRLNVDIVAAHGKAGGKTAGATINQVDDLRRIFPVADIYLCGHDHKRGVWPESTLVVNANHKSGELEIKQKRQLLCRTGSFLRGYVDGATSYVADRYLRPCELGTIRLEIKPKNEQHSYKQYYYPDIHANV